jgi:hypothetical protein
VDVRDEKEVLVGASLFEVEVDVVNRAALS